MLQGYVSCLWWMGELFFLACNTILMLQLTFSRTLVLMEQIYTEKNSETIKNKKKIRKGMVFKWFMNSPN